MQTKLSRLEVKMLPDVRDELENLAVDLGTSPSELMRLGLRWVLSSRALLTNGPAFVKDTREAA